MRRALPVFLSAALAALSLTPAARALGSPPHSRPPGIAASDWVPIGNDLAAVIGQQAPDLIGRRSYAGAQPLVLGYFVAWRGGHWLRLDSLAQQPMSRSAPGAASARISIGGNLAFVIERQLPGQPMRGQPPTSSALGYFVVRRDDYWMRLQPIAEGALFRGPLTSQSISNWVPINRGLRFIVEQQMPQRHAAGQLPSVLGYFVAKHDGRWLRLGSIA
jgi:hypothetical protein